MAESDSDPDNERTVPWRPMDRRSPVCAECGQPLFRPTTFCEVCGHLDPDGIAVEARDYDRDEGGA